MHDLVRFFTKLSGDAPDGVVLGRAQQHFAALAVLWVDTRCSVVLCSHPKPNHLEAGRIEAAFWSKVEIKHFWMGPKNMPLVNVS